MDTEALHKRAHPGDVVLQTWRQRNEDAARAVYEARTKNGIFCEDFIPDDRPVIPWQGGEALA